MPPPRDQAEDEDILPFLLVFNVLPPAATPCRRRGVDLYRKTASILQHRHPDPGQLKLLMTLFFVRLVPKRAPVMESLSLRTTTPLHPVSLGKLTSRPSISPLRIGTRRSLVFFGSRSAVQGYRTPAEIFYPFFHSRDFPSRSEQDNYVLVAESSLAPSSAAVAIILAPSFVVEGFEYMCGYERYDNLSWI
ncbi:hypothetical protein PoB_003114500 [Plakobranchus ocellatus]|uniref:Uncharacterized protein n=1 Tax=Plakobranchus ocellatus TaxID=259542 RepID=A0AAV4AB76_9GAST|nr:hypothetical protein PoB_003114500 [Plakobranchus ocellatus]